MFTIQNLSKRYGSQIIFDRISLSINSSERVGLVGRNGHGKTTLFNLLTGEEMMDEGTITFPKNYSVGHLNQQVNFSKPSVLEEGCCGLPDDEKTERWKVEKILFGLGFSSSDMQRDPTEFSGGYQLRLNLAKVLVSEPNLLLLDEPTNFLDIISIRWLVRFLNAWRNEMVVISHDRGFMDGVATHIIGIHRSAVKKISGSTDAYYSRIEKEEEVYEKQRVNEEKKQNQMEQFIDRFRAKARHSNLVQSRIKTLKKQEKLYKLKKIPNLSFSFNAAPCPHKGVLEANNITFSYNGSQPYLIDPFNLAVEKNDKICIVGKNGKGKTTLLKLLAGRLSPLQGEIKIHPKGKISYFEQMNTAELNKNMTVEEEILLSSPLGDRKKARDICGAMMFPGDSALKKIGVLSGGEKCRVLLGKLLVMPANLLLLDEPTHHLDMESCETMMKAVSSFQGAAIIVTHNERILHRIANKLIVFQHDRLFIFNGGYSQFLDRIGWDEQEEISFGERNSDKQKERKKNPDRKDMRKLRAKFVARRSKTLNPYTQKIKELERDIEKMEHQVQKENQSLIKASYEQDGAAISTLSTSLHKVQKRIDILYQSLEKVNEKYELEKQVFQREENSFDNPLAPF